MKAELRLYAETEKEEKLLREWKDIHFQTYVQDFLEEEMFYCREGKDSIVELPDIIYIGKDGNIIEEVLQGD